ncbi:MAG: putative zinc-binding metallopeptidase [Ilumatobacteraceae bacterium]
MGQLLTNICPNCGFVAFLDGQHCERCGVRLGFHHPSLTFHEVVDGVAVIDGRRWIPCSRWDWQCNWLLAEDDERARCFSCRLNRTVPAADDTIAQEKLATTDVAKRRLLVQLMELGLPVVPWDESDIGLGFDMRSSFSGERVTIGHASGVITIDLAESLADHREHLRVVLGEPYRTMLGHFRHEVGHYYQWILVADDPLLAECRALFGDERASYSDAIDRHYRLGPPDGWQAEYISSYATMHPWEDFAETWAHYLHITGTLTSAGKGALRLEASRAHGLLPEDVVPRVDYGDATIEQILADWQWLSLLFNRVNRAMGKDDLYPFTLVDPVKRKLGFVHRVITEAPANA